LTARSPARLVQGFLQVFLKSRWSASYPIRMHAADQMPMRLVLHRLNASFDPSSLPNQVADGIDQFECSDRLGEVDLKAGLHCPGSIFRPGERRKRDRGNSLASFAGKISYFLHELVPIFFRHADIADNDIRQYGLEALQSFGGVCSREYVCMAFG
jgi:hypothetical protein